MKAVHGFILQAQLLFTLDLKLGFYGQSTDSEW